MSGEKLLDVTSQGDWVPGRDEAPVWGPVIGFGSEPPVNGSWGVGDTIYNEQVASNLPSGWVCIVAGTPGKWVALPENVNYNSFEDTFDRADGQLDPNRYLVGQFVANALKFSQDYTLLSILSKQLRQASVSSAYYTALYKGAVLQNAQVSVKIPVIASTGINDYVGLILRANPLEPSTCVQLFCQLNNGGGNTWTIQACVNGTRTVLQSSAIATIAANDVISFKADGTNLVASKNGSALLTVAESNLAAENKIQGFAGLSLYNNTTTNARYSNLVITDI